MIGNNPGFTLVEALMAAAIMSIVMITATTIMVLFFKGQGQAKDQLNAEATARNILAQIAEHTRAATLDYTFYASTPATEPTFLALRDSNGIQTVFQFFGSTIYICDQQPADQTCDKAIDPSTSVQWSAINPTVVPIVSGTFIVSPDTSPYIIVNGVAASDQAPLVGITLQLSTNGVNTDLIQTSFTTRYYAR